MCATYEIYGRLLVLFNVFRNFQIHKLVLVASIVEYPYKILGADGNQCVELVGQKCQPFLREQSFVDECNCVVFGVVE